jgi:hypothetical protein
MRSVSPTVVGTPTAPARGGPACGRAPAGAAASGAFGPGPIGCTVFPRHVDRPGPRAVR